MTTHNNKSAHWESSRSIKRGHPMQPAKKLPAQHGHAVDRNNLVKDNFGIDFTETASLANPTIPRFPDSDYPILPTAFFTHDFTSILLCRNTYWAEFTSLLKFTKSMGNQWIEKIRIKPGEWAEQIESRRPWNTTTMRLLTGVTLLVWFVVTTNSPHTDRLTLLASAHRNLQLRGYGHSSIEALQ